jgi:hypothetical protein
MFIFITRKKTPYIEQRLQQLLRAGIDAYVVVDELDSTQSKRYITYSDYFMEEKGWTHHMSRLIHKVTAWDKATYFAYQSGEPYVWFCEDDVFWNKPSVIRSIVDNYESSNVDLVAHPLAHTFDEYPSWYHWNKTALLTKQRKYWSATFNQLSRVSRRLLVSIAELSQKRKRLFFHETMFPTICKMNGFEISYLTDLKLPIQIIIRWDKPFTKEQIEKEMNENKNVLLHPVKLFL